MPTESKHFLSKQLRLNALHELQKAARTLFLYNQTDLSDMLFLLMIVFKFCYQANALLWT